jgi:hypothetical protein
MLGHERETNKQNRDEMHFQMVFPLQIRLRAGWVAVIIAPLAISPAMDDRYRRMVGGNRPGNRPLEEGEAYERTIAVLPAWRNRRD